MSETAQQDLTVTHDGHIATVRLNRPQKRNALSVELLAAIDDALVQLSEDRESRVVILCAEGPVFSSGHDLKQMVDRSAEDYRTLFDQCSITMQRLRQIPQPVIAKVHGLATAAGCQLVASCDLVVASEKAMFATPGVKIGLFCTTPMVPLVRGIPPKLAMEMLLTGVPISAQRAYEVGFVNRVATENDLDQTVSELAQQIAAASPLTVSTGKKAFYDQLSVSEEEAYQRAVQIMTDNAVCGDAQEGISAFLEKRPAVWKGN